jgi:membrane-associated protease RseP (regulator of RpoE activity)
MVTIPTLAFALVLWLAAPPTPAPPAVPSPPPAAVEAVPPAPPVPPEEPEPAVLDDDDDVVAPVPDDPVIVSGHPGRARGFLGVHLLDLTPELREHFGVPRDAGVMVAAVEPGSAAAKGGIAVGDIITSADGDRIDSARDLSRAVRRKKAGETVRLDLSRDRSNKRLTVAVEERRRPEFEIGELGDLGRLGKLGPEIRMRVMRDLESARPLLEQRRERLEKRLDRMQKRLDELEKKLSRMRD